jgi:hypothetical protein
MGVVFADPRGRKVAMSDFGGRQVGLGTAPKQDPIVDFNPEAQTVTTRRASCIAASLHSRFRRRPELSPTGSRVVNGFHAR